MGPLYGKDIRRVEAYPTRRHVVSRLTINMNLLCPWQVLLAFFLILLLKNFSTNLSVNAVEIQLVIPSPSKYCPCYSLVSGRYKKSIVTGGR